jgi:hypothetical protein
MDGNFILGIQKMRTLNAFAREANRARLVVTVHDHEAWARFCPARLARAPVFDFSDDSLDGAAIQIFDDEDQEQESSGRKS